MSPSIAVIATLLLLSVASCGGKSSVILGEAGSDQGGSSGQLGIGGAAMSGGGAGSAGDSGGFACDAFDDESPTLVRVSISNQTNAPIYLGQQQFTCGVSPLFQVADAAGADLPSLGACRSSCLELRTKGQAGCPTNCAFPNSIALQPGEALNTTWDGLFRVSASLPGKCTSFDPNADLVSCDQAKGIAPGSFTFSANAGTAQLCSQTPNGTCSACQPSADGGCTTSGGLIGGDILSTQTQIVFDESYGVYPRPAAPAKPSPGGSASPLVRSVDLVFGP